MRQLFRYALLVLGTVSAVVLVYHFRVLVLLMVVALALTAASRPFLVLFRKFRIPGFLAQFLLIIILLTGTSTLILLIGPVLWSELQRLTNSSIVEYSSFYAAWESGPSWQQTIIRRIPEPNRLVDYLLGANGELLLPAALNLTQNLAGFFTNLFMILGFSLYLAQDEQRFVNLWLSFLNPDQRRPIRKAWTAVEQVVGRYLRQELAMGLLSALLLGIGYAMLGIPYPTTLALLALVGWFIPIMGFAVILVPVYLAAASSGMWIVGLSLTYTLIILLGLKYWIEPQYLHLRRYSSFLIVFWIVVLGNLMGPGGYLAGPVVAVVTETLWIEYLKYRARPELDQIRLADLRKRYKKAYARYAEVCMNNPYPQLDSLIVRLESSLSNAELLAHDRMLGD